MPRADQIQRSLSRLTIDRRRFTDRLKDISPCILPCSLFSLRQVSNRVEISMSAILI